MDVASAVGRSLAQLGVDHVFGLVGSGNFHVTNALVDGGARFVAARHENGAATMADAYALMSGRVTAVSVHQGCGLSNAMTGITEAAKSRSPVVVLAAEATDPRSNFYVDQEALATAVGAVPMRVTTADHAVQTAAAAYYTALDGHRTVLLNLPLPVQAEQAPAFELPSRPARAPAEPDEEGLAELVHALRSAGRPVFVAGRGARGPGSKQALYELADTSGALLATSAVAKGLFHDNPWSLDVSGGFASPLAAELISGADLIVGWGCALNMWTMRHGRLIAPEASVAQVDIDPTALGAHRDIQVGVTGGVRETAHAANQGLAADGFTSPGYRSDALQQRIASKIRWRDTAYDDTGTTDRIDPRTLSIGLDDLLPADRVVAVDSGNFMGYPSMFLSVPDENGFCFSQAFQSVGLGLSTAIGTALARPDRLPVAALGDGGLLMAAAELETVGRLGLPMVIVAYNDAAYGAEVHHFAPDGYDLSTVRFPDPDLAAIGRGHGFDAITVRRSADLDAVRTWVTGARDKPLLVDAKITSEHGAWWLQEAFGH